MLAKRGTKDGRLVPTSLRMVPTWEKDDDDNEGNDEDSDDDDDDVDVEDDVDGTLLFFCSR